MTVDVEWQDENGNGLARYLGPPLMAEILERVPAGTVCLRFIDPFGDTTFNQAQIQALASELEAWAENDPAPVIRRLLDFVAAKRGHTHTYLKFVGD